jgi:hypothetical protein
MIPASAPRAHVTRRSPFCGSALPSLEHLPPFERLPTCPSPGASARVVWCSTASRARGPLEHQPLIVQRAIAPVERFQPLAPCPWMPVAGPKSGQ